MSKEVLPLVWAVQVDEQWVVLHEESQASTGFCTLFMEAEANREGDVRES